MGNSTPTSPAPTRPRSRISAGRVPLHPARRHQPRVSQRSRAGACTWQRRRATRAACRRLCRADQRGDRRTAGGDGRVHAPVPGQFPLLLGRGGRLRLMSRTRCSAGWMSTAFSSIRRRSLRWVRAPALRAAREEGGPGAGLLEARCDRSKDALKRRIDQAADSFRWISWRSVRNADSHRPRWKCADDGGAGRQASADRGDRARGVGLDHRLMKAVFLEKVNPMATHQRTTYTFTCDLCGDEKNKEELTPVQFRKGHPPARPVPPPAPGIAVRAPGARRLPRGRPSPGRFVLGGPADPARV